MVGKSKGTSMGKGKAMATYKGKAVATGKGKVMATYKGKAVATGKGKAMTTFKGKAVATYKGKAMATYKGKAMATYKGKAMATYKGKAVATGKGKAKATVSAKGKAKRKSEYVFYHYTDEKGIKAIEDSGHIKQSEYGFHGSGVYGNWLNPKKYNKSEIGVNNYGPSSSYKAKEMVEYAVKVKVPKMNLKRINQNGRGILLYDKDINLKKGNYEVLKVPSE